MLILFLANIKYGGRIFFLKTIDNMKNSTLITGLWQHENENGEEFLIGRIGHNLNAVIVQNKTKEGNQPDFHLFFFNGSVDDAKKAIAEGGMNG